MTCDTWGPLHRASVGYAEPLVAFCDTWHNREKSALIKYCTIRQVSLRISHLIDLVIKDLIYPLAVCLKEIFYL